MKTPYNLLKRTTTGFMAYIALDGYIRAIINDNKSKESDLLIQDTINKYELAVKQIKEKESIIASDNVEIIASLGRIKQDIDLVNIDAHNLTNQISINKNQGIETSTKILNKSASNLIDEINKLMDKIDKRSVYNNNYLDNIFQFRDLFSSYNTAELGNIGHIFACFFIFGCLFDIAIAYYGDFLIVYFKLEEKYPWLLKWIRLRRKFQHYYIGLIIFLIIIALLFIIYVNWVVLKQGK